MDNGIHCFSKRYLSKVNSTQLEFELAYDDIVVQQVSQDNTFLVFNQCIDKSKYIYFFIIKLWISIECLQFIPQHLKQMFHDYELQVGSNTQTTDLWNNNNSYASLNVLVLFFFQDTMNDECSRINGFTINWIELILMNPQTQMHSRVLSQIHTCTHTYTHTHAHAHTHSLALSLSLSLSVSLTHTQTHTLTQARNNAYSRTQNRLARTTVKTSTGGESA